MKKAKTSTFLNASIPGVLALVAQDTSDKTLNTATRALFPAKWLLKLTYTLRRARTTSLNGRSNAKQAGPTCSTRPSTCRTGANLQLSLYIRGKQGNLDKDDTVLDITTSYQALHEVEIFYAGGRTSNFQVKLEPTMPLKTTAAIRTIYQCDCKAFWGTSWVC
ncbi:hypothetical protein PC121_g5430 [Phytophthora cactorum]|nr:hypothetical protein PC121_g5430 [Phytophthora cactorum]